MTLLQSPELNLQSMVDDAILSPPEYLALVDEPQIDTRLLGGIAHIAGASVPYTLELPEDIIDPIPSMIVPGFGGIKPSYRGLRHAIATQGKPAISYRPPRTQSLAYAFNPSHLMHPEKLQSQATWGIMKDVMRRDDTSLTIDSFDLDLHSMGGLTGSQTALHKPDYVRSMVLIASAGLTDHSRLQLLSKMPGFVGHDVLEAYTELRFEDNVKAALHMVDYLFRNPPRTLREAWVVGGCDIKSSVKSLGELGVKTAVLAFAKDPLFALEVIQKNMSSIVDWFVEYSDPNARHTPPQIDPNGVASSLIEIHQHLA